jgi:hypothetical protein
MVQKTGLPVAALFLMCTVETTARVYEIIGCENVVAGQAGWDTNSARRAGDCTGKTDS